MSNENIFVKSEDKVILSDFLFTVYNGFMNHPKNVVVETCVNFYDEETIWGEKIRFFEAVGKKANARRSGDRKSKNVEDIITEIEARDASNGFLPVFAASRLHNIPRSQDGAVTNAQIMGCLKHFRKDVLSSLRQAPISLSNSKAMGRSPIMPTTPGRRLPTTPSSQSSPRRDQIAAPTHASSAPTFLVAAPFPISSQTAPNSVLTASSTALTMPISATTAPTPTSTAPIPASMAPIPSSPTPAAPFPASAAAISASAAPFPLSAAPFPPSAAPSPALAAPSSASATLLPASAAPSSASEASFSASAVPSFASAVSLSASAAPFSAPAALLPTSMMPVSQSRPIAATNLHAHASTATTTSTQSYADIMSSAHISPRPSKQQTKEQSDIRGKRKRLSSSQPRSRKPLLVGKKVSDGRLSWKGADLTANFYVGRVNNNVDPKMIIDDIETLGVRVIEFEELKLSHSRFKSFRLCIRKSEASKLLVEDFWPEDVVIDRFFKGKNAKRDEQEHQNGL